MALALSPFPGLHSSRVPWPSAQPSSFCHAWPVELMPRRGHHPVHAPMAETHAKSAFEG